MASGELWEGSRGRAVPALGLGSSKETLIPRAVVSEIARRHDASRGVGKRAENPAERRPSMSVTARLDRPREVANISSCAEIRLRGGGVNVRRRMRLPRR